MSKSRDVIDSIECPECGNTLWEKTIDWNSEEQDYDEILRCTNCYHSRPYIRRRPQTDHISKSQERKIAQLRRFFTEYENFGRELHKFEVTLDEESGLVWVSVHTTGNVFTDGGGHFSIGRRGKTTIWNRYGLTDREHTLDYYSKMLNAHIHKSA